MVNLWKEDELGEKAKELHRVCISAWRTMEGKILLKGCVIEKLYPIYKKIYEDSVQEAYGRLR